MNIEEFRNEYPQYDNIDDATLVNKIYNKYYASKIPREEFYGKIGYSPVRTETPYEPTEEELELEAYSNMPSKLKSAIIGANTAFGRVGHGILQPALEGEFGKEYLDPFANYLREKAHEYLPEHLKPRYEGMPIGEASRDVAARREQLYELEKARNPLSTKLGFGGGTVGMALPGIEAGGAGLIPFAGSGMLASALGGGLSGGLGGAAEYVNPGESRLSNAKTGALIGATLPLAGRALKETAKGVFQSGKGLYNIGKNVKEGYPLKKAAETVKSIHSGLESKFQNKYDELLKKPHEAGIKYIREPINKIKPMRRLSLSSPPLKKNNPNKYGEAFAKFEKNPTPELAQKAQSDIGKLIYEIRSSKTGKVSSEKAKIAELTKLRKGIISDLENTLEKASPGAGKEYRKVSKEYGKELAPFNETLAFRKLLAGRSGDKKFINRLIKDEDFMHRAGRKIPALKSREEMPELIQALKKSAILGGGGLATLGGLGYFGNKLISGGKNE